MSYRLAAKTQALGASRRRMTGSVLHLVERENRSGCIRFDDLPSDEFVLVQLSIAADVQFPDDFSSASFRIAIASTVGLTHQIVLPRKRENSVIESVTRRAYHRRDQLSQFLLIDLSVIGDVVPEHVEMIVTGEEREGHLHVEGDGETIVEITLASG